MTIGDSTTHRPEGGSALSPGGSSVRRQLQVGRQLQIHRQLLAGDTGTVIA